MKTLVLADNLRDPWNFMEAGLCVSRVHGSSERNSIVLKRKKGNKKTGNFSRLAIITAAIRDNRATTTRIRV